MEYLQKHFPLAFESIEKLMKEHGAPKRDGDDTEWRKHPVGYHLQHASDHFNEYDLGYTLCNPIDPDSKMSQLVHVACRDLMALEVHLGGVTTSNTKQG